MGYRLEGDLLEVCDCKVLCPCWIGEDPDNGGCRTALAYVMRAGEIDGVDVSGLVVAVTAWIPGNVLDGGYVQKIYVDARADEAQGAALAELMLGGAAGRSRRWRRWSPRRSASSGRRSSTRSQRARAGSASPGWSRRR